MLAIFRGIVGLVVFPYICSSLSSINSHPMKILLLSIPFMLFGIAISAQSRPQSLADSLQKAGNLKEAIVEFAKIYKENPNDTRNLGDYAGALALDKQIDSAFHYLRLATVNDSTAYPMNDPSFYFLLEDERWAVLQEEQMQRIEAKHGPYLKRNLTKELWNMKIKDQAFYYHIRVADEQMGKDSPVIKGLWELKKRINAENLSRIQEIIDEQGWPKKSDVKGSAAQTVFLVIQHSDFETQKKYLPIMQEAADAGEAEWSALALLIDRVNLKEGKKQIYGSQLKRLEDGSYIVNDLFEPEYVNQRRKQVGLGPIEDYVSRWGVVWDVEQKEK